jgi:hypothetical protein
VRIREAEELGLVLDQGHEGGDDRPEACPVVGVRLGELTQQTGQQDRAGDPLEDGVDEFVLVREVAVDHRLGDPGAPGDVVHGEVGAGAPDGLHRGADEVLPARPPVLGPAGPPAVLVRGLVHRWTLGT